MAQNVYSLNVVGYYNVTIPGLGFKMIANQLDAADNTLDGALSGVADGSLFYKWTGAGYSIHEYIEGDGWDPNTSLAPGEGGFLRNASADPVTVTFVGEVKQGSLVNEIPAGFSIKSSMVPQAGGIKSVLGMPFSEDGGDYIYKWGTSYEIFEYVGEDEWDPAEPAVAVGESFFSRKLNAATWTREFTVPQ